MPIQTKEKEALPRDILTASILTLGCKLNQAESYRIQSELASAGVEIRPFGESVDLSIVNTCTVTHVADQQARQSLRRAARLSPRGCVVAMGCYAQVAPDEVAKIEGVDLVIRSDKERLLEQLEAAGFTLGLRPHPFDKLRAGSNPLPEGAAGEFGAGERSRLRATQVEGSGPDHLVPLPASRVRQFVKVQDGCDDYCTYCIVPFARGHALSRPANDIVAEVQGLQPRGCREVVLTGVQIGAYGRDRYRLRQQGDPIGRGIAAPVPSMAPGPARHPRNASEGGTQEAFRELQRELPAPDRLPAQPGAPLAALVRRLLDETTIARIRISSIQPQDWPDEFVQLFADRRVCHHLHLPLQSGSDHTLRRMARRYSTAQFAGLVDRVRHAVPDIALTADMIVGFPGETEADHQESLRFAREMGFSAMHVFRYSPRNGTAASRMGDQVPAEAKQQRSQEMRALGDELAAAFRGRFLGGILNVLWEEELPLPQSAVRPGFPQPRGDASVPPLGGTGEGWGEGELRPAREGMGGTPSPLAGEGWGEGELRPGRHWTGLTGNYLRVHGESAEDWLGHEMPMRLAAADGDSLLGMPLEGE